MKTTPPIELDVLPRTTPRRWAPIHYCDVCQGAVERYAVRCHACGTDLAREDRPGAMIGRPIGLFADDELPRALDPMTGGWAPLPGARPLLPPPRRAPAPTIAETILDVPNGVWMRLAAYPLFIVLLGSVFCCCRMSRTTSGTLLACALAALAVLVIKARRAR